MSTPTIHLRPGSPDFLDLDWELPIDEWHGARVVDMPTGIHRHPVRFVAYDEGIYAVKELPLRLARHESEVLRTLAERTTRTVRVAGLVERSWLPPDVEGAGVIITRYLEYAFPYRELVTGGGFGKRRVQLLDAFAGLLVELHLSGCFWGDTSLSNVLLRWDGANLESLMVDAETTQLYDELSDGQRREDLEIMEMNVAGEMADIAASRGFDLDRADLSLGGDIADRYNGLWHELNEELVIGPDQSFLIRERLSRLNDLGFSVEDIELEPTDQGDRVRMKVTVGGRTFQSEQLRMKTGIDASENQARLILSDLAYHEHKFGGDSRTGKAVAAMKWRATVFEPIIVQIAELLPGSDPIQKYTDFLNHRYQLAHERNEDVTNEEAFESWVAADFPGHLPAEGDTDQVPVVADT